MGQLLINLSRRRLFGKQIVCLLLLIASLHWTQASAACPVHNHLCTFHALGADVKTTLPPGVTFNPANSLVMYAIGKDPVTGAASTVDFDNEAKLPTYTGDKFLAGNPVNYTISAGPYIVNTTTYGATHPPGTWSVPGDSGLQVTPSQYKNTFNANTAIAKHTGDFNGGENGNIPGATGCPNMPGAANCEAVVVTGNVPSGIYEQKVRLFNFYGVPDPKVDLQVGAYVTGQLVIVANSHDVNQVASFPKLEGTGNTTPTYSYEVYNRQFDPHAAGVATFDRMNWGRVRTVGNEYVQNGHRFLTQVQDSTTTRTKVYGDTGWATQTTWANTPKVVAPMHLGAVPAVVTAHIPGLFDPLAAFRKDSTPWNAPIQSVKINVPYKIGVDVAAVEADNRQWLEKRADAGMINYEIVFPKTPAGLPEGWWLDPSHKYPEGERWRSPSGNDYTDWHPGKEGKPGWRGKDHWHWNGEDRHYIPGDESPEERDGVPKEIVIGVGAVGAGYLIYRGVRMTPSLFPPLWPTIPANLALP